MTTARFAANPATGEIVADLGELGREYVRLMRAVEEAEAEHQRLRNDADDLRSMLMAYLPEGEVIDAGTHVIGWGPPERRPAQRVDMRYAERHREVLVDLGVATLRLAPVKGEDVRAHAVKLRAAGVDPDALLPDPGPGAPALRVEVKG